MTHVPLCPRGEAKWDDFSKKNICQLYSSSKDLALDVQTVCSY